MSLPIHRLHALEAVIRAAGDLMRRVPDHVRENPSEKEGSANFVTAYDLAVQEQLKADLAPLFPGAVFFAEEDGESAATLGAGYTFIIDPIDGTTNFMCGYDTSAVSVGLLLDGEPIFGAVYDPYRDEYFMATRGGGATCNGKPIRVSQRPLGRAVVAIGSAPYQKSFLAPTTMAMTTDLYLTFADFRRSGSAALDICYVAAGRTDAYCEPILAPWDFAAGSLILAEAGGLASNFRGEPLTQGRPNACVFGSSVGHPAALAVCLRYAEAVKILF